MQDGLTALALQIGGGNTITGGQVYDVWDGVVSPVATGATVIANSGSTDTYLADYVQTPSPYSSKVMTASVYLRVPSGTQNVDLFIVNTGASKKAAEEKRPIAEEDIRQALAVLLASLLRQASQFHGVSTGPVTDNSNGG